MNIIALIPARMASTRLPGKPLADIGGLPMVVHTWRAAARHPEIERAVVATDHEDIAEAVRRAGGEALLTGTHVSGTDRCHEAWHTLGTPDAAILNLQGDEPFPDKAHLDAMCAAMQEDRWEVVTPVRPAKEGESAQPERVKVATDALGRAIAFSRSPITSKAPNGIHIGMYGFAPGMLAHCAGLPEGVLEKQEKLEQLRWLEAGVEIGTVAVSEAIGPGPVDTPEDLDVLRRWHAVHNP